MASYTVILERNYGEAEWACRVDPEFTRSLLPERPRGAWDIDTEFWPDQETAVAKASEAVKSPRASRAYVMDFEGQIVFWVDQSLGGHHPSQ